MKKAAIDLGSNVAQLVIAQEISNEEVKFEHFQRVTGLGEKTRFTNIIGVRGMSQTLEALTEYKKILIKENVAINETLLLATEACRIAKNCPILFAEIEKIGFKPQLISDSVEAHYAAMGVVSDMPVMLPDYLVMDIGGASTELSIISGQPHKILNFKSFKIGTLEVSDWYENNQLDSKINLFIEENSKLLYSFKRDFLFCALGAITTIFNLIENNTSVEEKSFHQHKINSQIFLEKLDLLIALNQDELIKKFTYVRPRIATLPAAFILARTFINLIKPDLVVLSARGLAHGAILNNLD